MKISVVTTTINLPVFLSAYLRNFREYNNVDNVTFIIVGDHKTPKLYERLEEENVEYWNPSDQDGWLKGVFPRSFERIKELIIPENDMRRRNFGFLRAIELQSDIVITIDDDNYPIEGASWLDGHIQGLNRKHIELASKNQLINPCRNLKLNHEYVYSVGYPLTEYFKNNLYSRGYPLTEYFKDTENRNPSRCLSILNLGLWTGKPDVDSFTNILYPDLNSEGLHSKEWYSLSENTYFPVDTQNTSFTKDLDIFHNLYMIPELFHRFDDVWMGLFAQKLIHRMGDTASFGLPLVDHRRNSHDYTQDFKTEFLGIVVNNWMWRFILDIEIESKTYQDGFIEIASKLPGMFKNTPFLHRFFEKMRDSMVLWVRLIDSL